MAFSRASSSISRLREAELGQDIGGIGAERRRRHRRRRIAARQPEARAHDPHRLVDVRHILEGAQQLPLLDLRMLEHGRHVEHLARRHAVLVEQGRPLRGGLGHERALDLVFELEAVALAILAAGEARIRHQILAADQAAQRLELLLLVGRDVEQAVAGAERAGRARGHVLVAHRLGRTAAISQFDTCQPMATRVDSSIDTSMSSPSPLRSRRNSAAAIAKAAVMPPIVSATG